MISDTIKRIFLSGIAFLLTSIFMCSSGQRKQPDISALDDEIAQAKILSFHKILPPVTHDFRTFFVRFELSVDPDTIYIKGTVTHYFEVTDSTESLNFELSDSLDVDSVIYSGLSVPFIHDTTNLRIDLPSILPSGSVDSVSIIYQGSPPTGNGLGSFAQGSYDTTMMIWTLSQPYGCSDWWPCAGCLSPKIDSVEMIVFNPSKYRAVSNGLLIRNLHLCPGRLMQWKHRYPIAPYLIAFAVAQYTSYSDYAILQNGPLEILNYVYPAYFDTAVLESPGIIPIIELFDDIYGPYPFENEHYGHALFDRGGGMEHQTMSFMGDLSFHLMSHELAHQWFGNSITCGSWQDIWLNEGFATYSTGLAYEFLAPVWWPIWKEVQINKVCSQPDGSVFVYDTSQVSRIFDSRLSYAKGAGVLHMIRWIVGDSVFFAGVKNYMTDPTLSYGYALTSDLKQHFENSSGMNLSEFFNDWVYGEGYPEYNIQAISMNGTNIRVIINQSTSHSSVTFFEMPVPLLFSGNNKDTLIVFNHQFSGESFDINPGFTVSAIEFDPELWLFAQIDTIALSVDGANTQNTHFTVFPNPAQEYVNIKSGKAFSLITVFDSGGKVIRKIKYDNGVIEERIDIRNLKTGTYIIELRGKNWKKQESLVISP